MFRQEERVATDKENENPYLGFLLMEDLIEKLKILKYETLITSLKMKPIHKYYFMIPKNPGEQFFLFSTLAAWLIIKSGKFFDFPQEFDDPNTVITNIMDILRSNQTFNMDIPPNKLKQGVGDHVVFVLNHLADEALANVNFTWERAQPPHEKEDEAEVIEDESEIVLDRVEEEMLAAYSDDSEEENIFRIGDLDNSNNLHKKSEFDLTPNVDTESWKLELERVLPQLKVTIKSDNRDWRTHVEQMKMHQANIESSLLTTTTNLDKLHKEISSTLEKISNRERYLNKELEPHLEDYRLLQEQLSKVNESYQSISGGVTERTRKLATLTEKMESIKQQMEERGSSMTDGTPLVNIKKAITKLKTEISDMDVRIAVLDCSLLQGRLYEKNMLEQDLYQTATVF